MTRWSVGDQLLWENDRTIPNDLEIRTVEGSYWQRCGGTWEALTGPATSVSSERLFDSERPAVVTYVPAVPAPHTKPGHYVCTGECAYRFELDASGLWRGPWRPDGTKVSEAAWSWWQIEDNWGDCAIALVGPVPAVLLKGL